MHGAPVAETDLGFCRMHVNVDARGLDFEKNAVGRKTAAVQKVLLGLAQRMAEQLVAHEAAIDVTVLLSLIHN